MLIVLSAALTIGTPIGLGMLFRGAGGIDERVERSLNLLVLQYLLPLYLFAAMATVDLAVLFTVQLPIAALAAVVAAGTYGIVSAGVLRRRRSELVVGLYSASFSNGNNVGVPVGLVLFGSGAATVPVLLFQNLFWTPTTMTLLDTLSAVPGSVVRTLLLAPLRNPMVLGTFAGVLVAACALPIPEAVFETCLLVGGAAAPLALIAFGMTLRHTRPLGDRGRRVDAIVATVCKIVLMPAFAWVFGACVWGLSAEDLFAVVVFAALPTGQNALILAQRFHAGTTVARDTIVLTTIGFIPVIAVASTALL